MLLLTLILWLLVRRGERPWTVFFGDRPAAPEIAFGMLSLPVVIGLVLALTLSIRRFLPSLHNVPQNPLEGMLGSGASMWLFLVVVIVAGGVREELQRAFLLHRFRGDFGQPWMGVVITSISFGMGHTLQGLDAAIITGALGATWGVIYLTRGSALASHRQPLAVQLRRAAAHLPALSYCGSDDDVGPAAQIGQPVADQLGAARADQALAQLRRRLLESWCRPGRTRRAIARRRRQCRRRSACSPTRIAAPGRRPSADRRAATPASRTSVKPCTSSACVNAAGVGKPLANLVEARVDRALRRRRRRVALHFAEHQFAIDQLAGDDRNVAGVRARR